MAETTTPLPTPEKAIKGWRPFRWARENPVILRELRGRMRGRQAVFLLTAYLGLLALVVGLAYLAMAASPPYSGFNAEYRQTVGKGIFGTVVIMELLLVSFIAPSLCSGAITSEREHQTFELLRTTTLPAGSLVMGKLVAALAYLLLMIFAAVPIESIAFVLGGVGLAEIIGSTLMLIATALFYCMLGLFFSSLLKRTSAATLSSYVTIVVSYILLGLIFFLEASFMGRPDPDMEVFLAITFWFLISTNPLLAAIVSESILIDQQSLFFTSSSSATPFSAGTLMLPSPWIPYILFYVGLTILMIQVSIRLVRRPDR